MKIPFYYTFKEFEENYNNDLKKWFDSFPDAGESDYLNELRNEYQLFFYKNNSDFIINSNWIPDEYPEHYELSIIAYQEFMQEKLIQYLYNNGFSNFDGDYLDIPADTDVMDFWNDCNVRTRKNSAIIDDEKHKYLKEFFTFDNYTEKLNIDIKKFTNFKFATKKILDFVDEKINDKKPANIPHSTHEYIDEITQNKYSVPQKIKILDMLNIKGWLMDKHNFTTFQIEELLSDLFDRTDKTIRNSFSDSKHENTAQQYLEGLKKVKAKR